MTTATTEGRRLVLAVEGIDENFYVDPLTAKRGKYLTEQFLLASLGKLPGDAAEQIFIESIGASNYSRMTNLYVDEYGPDGNYRTTWDPSGEILSDVDKSLPPTGHPYFTAREALDGEPELDEAPLRQEECEALALAAFYWQTVVGMEAVNAFFELGGGTEGSLKALSLLQIRLGLSPLPSSSTSGTGSLTQQAGSVGTPDTPTSFGSARLPANKRGFMQNPVRTKPRRK